jgi:DNA-directed RNA polymerase II subunit RPB1
VHALTTKTPVVAGADLLSIEAQRNCTMLFHSLLRATLHSKRVLKEYRLSPQAFHWLVGEIEERFAQSLVNPGEMIGTVAAQSIGEPATQVREALWTVAAALIQC